MNTANWPNQSKYQKIRKGKKRKEKKLENNIRYQCFIVDEVCSLLCAELLVLLLSLFEGLFEGIGVWTYILE